MRIDVASAWPKNITCSAVPVFPKICGPAEREKKENERRLLGTVITYREKKRIGGIKTTLAVAFSYFAVALRKTPLPVSAFPCFEGRSCYVLT